MEAETRRWPRPIDVVAAALVAVIAGVAIGYWWGGSSPASAPADESVDVGFLRDMVAHHEQALGMANVLLASEPHPDIAHFAREILIFQSNEIGSMSRQLAVWGHETIIEDEPAMAWMHAAVDPDEMPGLATDAEMDALLDVDGRAADALFVRLMQDHHRGGVHMAEYAAANADDDFVRQLARTMAEVQTVEINEMEAAHKRLGLDPRPPGWQPDAFVADGHEQH